MLPMRSSIGSVCCAELLIGELCIKTCYCAKRSNTINPAIPYYRDPYYGYSAHTPAAVPSYNPGYTYSYVRPEGWR